MSKPLDELYYPWLYSQVGDLTLKDSARTYWRMTKQLFTKEFVWIVPNDDNRIADGKYLREEFVEGSGLGDIDTSWLELGCSILELMIGLSRRLAFEADGEPADWFWHIAGNVGLDKYSDLYRPNERIIDGILEAIIWRNYRADGLGGFFPLQEPREDQRKVELWYQISAYILERS